DVEAHRLRAVAVEAEHRLRGIVEGEIGRSGEGEAETGVQEAAAADIALARVFAVNQTVEAGGIVLTLALAGAGRGELPGVELGVAHPLRRRRVRGDEIERTRIAAAERFEIGVALHGGKETRRAERIVAGACGDADADAV